MISNINSLSVFCCALTLMCHIEVKRDVAEDWPLEVLKSRILWLIDFLLKKSGSKYCNHHVVKFRVFWNVALYNQSC